MAIQASRDSSAPRRPGLRRSSSLQQRRVLNQLETPALCVEHVEYAAGCSFTRHSEYLPFLACTVQGLHWSCNNYGGYTCTPGTARFLPAGEAHENYFPARSQCILVKLQEPVLTRAGEHASLPQRPVQFATHQVALLARLLGTELRYEDNLSPLAIEELALELLLAGSREPACPAAPIPSWLRRVHEMLREESGRRFTLAELARSANRHPVQVCRQFHLHFSCTIGEYVRRSRIAHAQSLLASPELSIAEIALICGFADQSQLTTAFRRLTGVAPGRYRNQLHAKHS